MRVAYVDWKRLTASPGRCLLEFMLSSSDTRTSLSVVAFGGGIVYGSYTVVFFFLQLHIVLVFDNALPVWLS